ncbi:hypothetical protein FA95DRAFT_217044 [Auriscalpium vulgare]|uniref:Uncharacterized protein n=1 Tax=Auriscalpium vulgare TaxID=40419 RepID=A0ACB8RKV0_9AGAM|nr:hypothetical protein FA95DRAFT_217044 [Auriscalpium vulgare]
MVKLSVPWDKDKDKDKVTQAGTSFTPSFNARTKNTASSSVFPSFRRFTSDPSSTTALPPLLTLKLSSPSFLETVVHDGISDNPLYVIDTDDNTTKIRRSDAKGFVNVARVRWRRDARSSRKQTKDLTGIQIAFGKGTWRPADELLANSYGTISGCVRSLVYSPPPFDPPAAIASSICRIILTACAGNARVHHITCVALISLPEISLTPIQCTTETVKGPVAILEPATLTTTPHLHIHDPLFRQDHSKPQRSHSGLPLSLLDFLLVTALLMLTPGDEWTNITREEQPEPFPEIPDADTPLDSGEASSFSLPPSPKHRPSASSLRSSTSDETGSPQSDVPVAPSIERWRVAVAPLPPVEDGPDGRRRRGPGSTSSTRRGPGSTSSTSRDLAPSRATSRGSIETDAASIPASPSTTTHYAASQYSQSHRTPFSMRSASSLSISSHHQPHYAGSINSRELPPLPVPPAPSRMSNELQRFPPAPPLPPVPPSSSASSVYYGTSSPPQLAPSRSLPMPPTPGGAAKSPQPPATPATPAYAHPHTPSRPTTPSRHHAAYDVSPPPPTPHQHPLAHAPSPLSSLSRAHSYGHLPRPPAPPPPLPPPLRAPDDHDHGVFDAYAAPTKSPPGYVARGEGSARRPAIGIRTSLDEAAVAAAGAGAGPAVVDEVPRASLYEYPPPAYSAVDMARSPMRMRTVNADSDASEER